MRLYSLLLIAIFSCVSCNKKVSTPPTTNTLVEDSVTISYTGSLLKKNYVYFTTNVGIGNNVVWYFGDSGISNELNPRHIYDTEGVYIVRLVVNGDTSKIYTREIAIQNANTLNVLGTRTWILKRRYAYKDGVKTDPSVITEYEQALEIKMVDPTTIKILENPYFPELTLKRNISNSSFINFVEGTESLPSWASLNYYISEKRLSFTTKRYKLASDGVTIIEEMAITSEIRI